MPRAARVKSSSGIYHVMLRGINHQQIFEEDEDYDKFIETVSDCKKVSDFKLYAYCLMGNHVHLLIQVADEEPGQIFKRIGSRYVYWYNWKYGRTGHLFQDRFKSEPVENDEYFLAVLRYIHQNPVKAGLVDSVDAYKWSSYSEYIGKRYLTDSTDVVQAIGLDEFIEYTNEANNDMFLESAAPRINDNEAKRIMKQLSGYDTVVEFQKLDIQTRNRYVKAMQDNGLSIRQISRLTGVSKALVEKACGA